MPGSADYDRFDWIPLLEWWRRRQDDEWFFLCSVLREPDGPRLEFCSNCGDPEVLLKSVREGTGLEATGLETPAVP